MKKQQIVISGLGGQGVLFLTRILSESALLMDLDVITSETHGMAQRGGTVISNVKIGGFKSSLIRSGKADILFLLARENLDIHSFYLKEDGIIYANTNKPGPYKYIDGNSIAKRLGSLVVANLIILGYALKDGKLFCSIDIVKDAIKRITPSSKLDLNIDALKYGYEISKKNNLL